MAILKTEETKWFQESEKDLKLRKMWKEQVLDRPAFRQFITQVKFPEKPTILKGSREQ